jgi:Ca2+-transporting ATPase
MTLCNDARLDASGEFIGDPTETALMELARAKEHDLRSLNQRYSRAAEIPFDSERKLMTTFHPWEDGRVVSFTKGAVESWSALKLL